MGTSLRRLGTIGESSDAWSPAHKKFEVLSGAPPPIFWSILEPAGIARGAHARRAVGSHDKSSMPVKPCRAAPTKGPPKGELIWRRKASMSEFPFNGC
jgi:hypothetical protein